MSKNVKTILKVSKQDYKEEPENPDFPHTYNELKEGECKLDESKPLDWIEVEIKFKEVDISDDG
jgi:hypothetical protein